VPKCCNSLILNLSRKYVITAAPRKAKLALVWFRWFIRGRVVANKLKNVSRQEARKRSSSSIIKYTVKYCNKTLP
jgi:hypothetical protein